MTKAQFSNGRVAMARVNDWLLGRGDDTAESIMDDVQLLFNEGELSVADYYTIVECVSPALDGPVIQED